MPMLIQIPATQDSIANETELLSEELEENLIGFSTTRKEEVQALRKVTLMASEQGQMIVIGQN